MIIAIIGEAGSGKTTAINFFQKHGAYIIVADAIVKYLYKMPKIEQEIIKVFGQDFVNEENKLDKKALRNYVFKNFVFLKKLETIIWPEMIKIIEQEIFKHKDTEKLVVLDCAVLFNAGLNAFVDKIILIEAEEPLKIKRIKERDNITNVQAINLLNIQKQHLILNKNIDYVIKNNGPIEAFIQKLMKFINKNNEWNF